MSALFSLLLTVYFVLQGLENKLLESASKPTGGTIYLTTSLCYIDSIVRAEDIVETIDEETGERLQYYNPKPPRCLVSQDDLAKVTKKIQKYGGKIAATVDLGKRQVPLEFIKTAIEVDLNKIKLGTVPAIISMDKAQELAQIKITKQLENGEKLRLVEKIRQETLGTTFSDNNDKTIFSVVGIISPGNDLSLTKKVDEFNILDAALNGMVNYSGGPMIVINDGSASTSEFLNQDNRTTYQVVLSTFNNIGDAFNYYINEDCGIRENNCQDYRISELYSNHLSVYRHFWMLHKIIGLFEPAFVVIGVIIIVFTFLRLISQDARIVALYRSLGATARDVFHIYLAYLVELCLLTIISTIILSSVVAVILSLANSSSLVANMAVFYGRAPQAPMILIGLNSRIIYLFGAILLSAPIASLLTIDQLSMKNIAKRLRKS